METSDYERGSGGKFRKKPLWCIRYSPYERPPLAAREILGPQRGIKAKASRWFSKLVDQSSRVVLRIASRFLSSFGKGLVALGEHIGAFEEVSEVKSSPETREQGENPSVVRPSLHCVGSDRGEQELSSRRNIYFQIEQLLKQATFSRAETDHIEELLNSRIIEPSNLPYSEYSNKRKINEDSSINSSLLHQAVNHGEREKLKANHSELEGQMEQQVNLHEIATSKEHANISVEALDSSIEIAKAYIGLKPQKAAPSTPGLRSQICPSNAVAVASKSPVCVPVIPTGSRTDRMTKKQQDSSTLHKFSRSPYYRTITKTTSRKCSPETREQGENPSVVRPSLHCDGSDRVKEELSSRRNILFKFEQLLKQATLSRAEIDRLAELLNSRTNEPSSLPSSKYKNKEKINEDSTINLSLLHQAVNHEEREKIKENPSELEGQMEQQVNLHKNVTSRENANFSVEAFDSPIEIARAYMGLKPRKAASSTLGLQSQICRRDFPLISQPTKASTVASKLPVCFPVIPTGSRNDCKPRGRSALYRLSRTPYYGTILKTNFREYSPYKGNNVEPTRSSKWTPSLSNIRPSNHGQALKRGISNMDVGCYGDARRVRQKSCFKDLNLPTHIGTSSKWFLSPECKHDNYLKSLDIQDDKIPSSVLDVPSRSREMTRKILHYLDNPQNKSFKKQAIVGDALFSDSSISASHEDSVKINTNNDSKVANVQSSRIFEEHSCPNFGKITSSISPNKDKTEGEASLPSFIPGAAAALCLGTSPSGTSASVTNHSMKFVNSNSRGFEVSANDATKPISTGISVRLNDGSLSAEPSSTGNGALKFQFGSGNSTSYSFTGLSVVSSATGVCTPVFSSLYPCSTGSGSSKTSAFVPTSTNGVFAVSTHPHQVA